MSTETPQTTGVSTAPAPAIPRGETGVIDAAAGAPGPDAAAGMAQGEILAELQAISTRLAEIEESLAEARHNRAQLSELIETLNPVASAAMDRATATLQSAEQRGYFVVAREGAAIVDAMIETTTEDDLRALRANVPTILAAVKQLSQPSVMALVDRTARTVQEFETAPMPAPTLRQLLATLREPQTRRGLAKMLAMLHTIGAQGGADPIPEMKRRRRPSWLLPPSPARRSTSTTKGS